MTEPDPTPPDGLDEAPDPPGGSAPMIEAPPSRIPLVDLIGTVALVLVIAASGIAESSATDVALLIVSAVLLIGGCIAFGIGFLRAVGRSRYEEIDLAGLFYLTGTVAPPVRTRLWRLLIVQIAAAVIGLWVNQPPFGTMAVVWGFGLMAMYGGLHGRFPVRPSQRGRRN